jgi:hypothetical protein
MVLVLCLVIGQVQTTSFDCAKASTLELVLDNLSELLLGATVPSTVPEGRESYYTNLYQLTHWLDARSRGSAPALELDKQAVNEAVWKEAA